MSDCDYNCNIFGTVTDAGLKAVSLLLEWTEKGRTGIKSGLKPNLRTFTVISPVNANYNVCTS